MMLLRELGGPLDFWRDGWVFAAGGELVPAPEACAARLRSSGSDSRGAVGSESDAAETRLMVAPSTD